jgi:aryl-phospho-beta-D-glucosidase BglC (GH1 family)
LWAFGCGGPNASEARDSDTVNNIDGGQSANPDSTGSSASPVDTVDYGPTPPGASGFLHVEGNRIKDDAGNVARLTGVNWFGFETNNQSPHGLWARDYRSMLRQIADIGFNTVRIPFANQMLREGATANSITTYGADPYDGTNPMNADLQGLSPLGILDRVIDAAREVGLKVMLDNHSREADGYMEEKLWYTEKTPEQQWIEDWRMLAHRYLGNTTVVAFDLNNEPHGEATWGTGSEATDWNSAAERCGNAVLEVNPDVLIVVEGVEKVGGDSYWWGGNLSAARQHPVELTQTDKLVYSAHEYGPEVFAQPWFDSAAFPSNLAAIWDGHFGYLMNEGRGHVFIGEFGIKDPEAFQGKSATWFDALVQYIGPAYSWTFWCWNPNSGDTEGILEYDWLTPKQWKLDAISPYFAPPIE